ncbi:CBN-MARC-6 protein [Caenorhabditis brenneri]|uniref:RING-type E3 ubiquitin transferase n=1 Tax=Caenorhabditis brenneri TaxID=135651 RepID=G0P9C4_CAEBE|nr:CBN-MARC-6 protein [Caenorhabditis brenneri]
MEIEQQRPPDVEDSGGDVSNQPSTSSHQDSSQQPNVEPIRNASIADDIDDHLMCRVCRGNEGNLYYPCLCTGSIKYVHQECLVEWLKYSKKEVCELCNHKYSFQPIYRPDMPKALPIFEILRGIFFSGALMIKTWLVYTFVMATWLGIVPLTAARIYNCIFYLSFHDIVSAPLQLFKTDHFFQDILKGSLLLIVFVCTFISLVWLREQIIVGGPQHFLNIEADNEGEDDAANEENESSDESGEDEDEEDDDDDDDDDEDDELEERIGEIEIEVEEEGNEDGSDSEESRGTPEPFETISDGPSERIIYIENDEFLNHREAVERGHPAALAFEERRRDIHEARYGFRPRIPENMQPYDDMRDDENEIVENEPLVPEHDAGFQEQEANMNDNEEAPQPGEGPIQAAIRVRRAHRERENAEAQEQAAAAAEQDDNWREWDRFGDELTWQRLLGLDGSLIFLEHVFWVISLNTLFTVTFAYVPYRFGNWFLNMIGMHGKITYFPSIAAMILGYIQIAGITFTLHQIMHSLKLKLMYRFLGIMFLIIKVFLLVFLEIGFFPVMCGCWMDVCTLPLFNITLSQRIATFSSAPFMSIFLHWMVGMVYVFYSASFVILLREILRPGVLWFMRNLNDPDFNPIQEMIDLPFTRHFRRLVVSTTLFFSTILLIFYIPLNIISSILPSLLPYNVSMSAETPLSEISLELLILQVVMPAILEHANGRDAIKFGVKVWCKIVGTALDLDQYLLSDNNNNNNQNNNNDPLRAGNQAAVAAAGGGLAAEHQALLLLREPRAYEPYSRPSLFAVRISILLVLMAATTTLSSVVVFTLPAIIGRLMILMVTGTTNVHEMYTVSIGLYVCWIIGKLGAIVVKFVRGGPHLFKRAVMHYSYLGMRLFLVAIPIIVVLPLLMGTYFQLVFFAPMRLGYQQTALMFPYQDWAMGVVQMKIFGVVAVMGPDWWLKSELDLLVQRGVENFAALHVFVRIVVPCILYLSTFIAFPVVVIKLYEFLAGADPETTMLLLRFSYPAFLFIASAFIFIRWQITKFSELAEKIKNDRYLVGTQLVNYERNGIRTDAAQQ